MTDKEKPPAAATGRGRAMGQAERNRLQTYYSYYAIAMQDNGGES